MPSPSPSLPSLSLPLAGRTALITGASGAIGRAICHTLQAQGATLALTGTRVAALEELADALGGAAIFPSHLEDADACAALVPAVVEKLGSLDILVNNAGITRDSLALRLKDADWDAVLAINLTAAFRLARAALRPMMKKRFGRIISTSSVVGSIGNPGQANYAAAKAGLEGMSRSLAAEVAARGITVNCVAPGFIRSAMTDALTESQQQAMLARIPAGRFGDGADIAAVVAFLAGDGAAYITGETLHVNGGMYMG